MMAKNQIAPLAEGSALAGCFIDGSGN